MSSATFTCGKCGHTDTLDAACRYMAQYHYRCTKCGATFEIVDEKPKRLPSGFVMPGTRKVVVR